MGTITRSFANLITASGPSTLPSGVGGKVLQVVQDFDKTDITVYKGFSLIPDSIFGVGLYVLIILFFIWILGDSGGECGVDYGPRFFGEC